MSAFLSGFSISLSLILAIGAQNAFVLKQGLKKHHVLLVCSICALSDAVLITCGVLGFGAVVQQFPIIETIARYGGAAFLGVYAAMSFYSAFTTTHKLNPEGELPASLASTAAACLAFTWLNPHVYLDTLVLLGSVSTQFETARVAFTAGAVSASFMFFFSLGYGARALIPVFTKPIAWKILEFVIGLVMLAIALALIVG